MIPMLRVFFKEKSLAIVFLLPVLLNKYYEYGDALSMSHLLVNHVTEHTQGKALILPR